MSQPTTPNPLHIVIAGGSIGGILSAIAILGRPYHGGTSAPSQQIQPPKVTIFERSPALLKDEGGGIVLQDELYAFYRKYGMASRPTQLGVPVVGRRYLDRSGLVVKEEGYPQNMTGWDELYWTARKRAEELGVDYEIGKRVKGFTERREDGRLVVQVESTNEGGHAMDVECDLLVGADGAASTVRRAAMHGDDARVAKLTYSGYIAFRGVIPEAQLPPDVADLFTQYLSFYTSNSPPHTSILCYMIPGHVRPGGTNTEEALKEGNRRLNFVWYWRVPDEKLEQEGASSSASESSDMNLVDLLKDRYGTQRHSSIPPGFLSEQGYQYALQSARDNVPPPFTRLVELAGPQGTFVQAVNDNPNAEVVHVNGRVVLVGDAACVVRPHTAAGTLKCAGDAEALGVIVADWVARRSNGREEREWVMNEMKERYGVPREKRNGEIKAFGVELGDQLLGFVETGGQDGTHKVAPNWK